MLSSPFPSYFPVFKVLSCTGPHWASQYSCEVGNGKDHSILLILQVSKHAQRIYMACPKSKCVRESGTDPSSPCPFTKPVYPEKLTYKAGRRLDPMVSQQGVGMETESPGWVQAKAPTPRLHYSLHWFLFKTPWAHVQRGPLPGKIWFLSFKARSCNYCS